MGTIRDKLNYLNDTKNAIRDAIVAKGVTVPNNATFREYASLIQQISGGGINDDVPTFTVIFMNGDTVLEVVNNVPIGRQAIFRGATPVKEGYHFSGWNPPPVDILEDTVCYASFSNTFDPFEIEDDWDAIVANRGVNYDIGAYRFLVLGTVNGFNYGTIRMQKVAEAENAANSVWVAMEAFADTRKMNTSGTTAGGWRESEMRSWLNETVVNVLPVSLQSSIKTMTKYSYDYDTGIMDIATMDKLWIPSRQEVSATNSKCETMGQSYSFIFKDANSRTRTNGYKPTGGGTSWYLRTAATARSFRYILSSGDESSTKYANNELGVVIGFGL